MAAATAQETYSGGGTSRMWAFAALFVALLGTAGSLSLSIVLGLKACPLCFYQRSFAMGALAVLAIGLAADGTRCRLHCLLSLPLAIAGLGIAAFHEYLVLTDKLECPLGLFGMGTAPAQSLGVFAVLTQVLLLATLSGGRDGRKPVVVVSAAALGLLFAWGCVAGAPPLPAPPKVAYDLVKQPLDMCRPPFPGD